MSAWYEDGTRSTSRRYLPLAVRSLAWDSVDELDFFQARVLTWSWLAPHDGRQVGVMDVVGRACRGVFLPDPEFERHPNGLVEAGILYGRWPNGSPRVYIGMDPAPLVAALLAIWSTLSHTGQRVPAQLDGLVLTGLLNGRLHPDQVDGHWSTLDAMFRGREVPEALLAKATVELMTAQGGR